MSEAVKSAEKTLSLADNAVRELTPMLCGRLKKAHLSMFYKDIMTRALRDLKKELKDFNSVTGEWK